MRGTLRLALAAVAAAAAGGCFSPSPQAGLPCTPQLECPIGQRCDTTAPGGPTCVVGDPGDPPDAPPGTPDAPPGTPDAPPGTPDAPPGTPDAPPGIAPNDLPQNAIDVGAGGTFMFDPSAAANDFTAGCTGPGGRDVFYTITLSAPEVIYADTFGSDFDAVLSITSGDCTPFGTGEACIDDACGGAQAQGGWNLAAGTHCIVVDQGGPSETGTMGVLHVVRTGHQGIAFPALAGTVTGDTCPANNDNNAFCGCEPAPDIHYFFTVCPSTSTLVTADVCTTSSYDAVLQIRPATGMGIACNDDSACGDSSVSTTISSPGLYFIVMDGCSACGTFTMNYDL